MPKAAEEAIDRGDEFLDEDLEYEVPENEELEDEDETLNEEESDDENEDLDTEDTEDEEDDEEDEEEAGPAASDKRIPKARLDEVIAQREIEREEKRLLQEQMNRMMDLMEKSTPKKEEPKIEKFEYDFDAKEDEYAEAVLDNEKDKAKAIRAEIRAAERRIVMEEMESLRGTAVQEAKGEAQRLRDEAMFEKTIAKNEEAHPFLDQSSDAYNQKAVDRVNDLFAKFAKAGMTQAEALQEAVDLVAPAYSKPAASKEALGGDRRKAALKKNASANNKQPPKLRGKTSRKDISDYDLSTMTDTEYAKLPASVKRKLRGD